MAWLNHRLAQGTMFRVASLIFLLICFFISAHKAHDEEAISIRELVAPPGVLKYFHLGFRYALADSFWLRALQDLDLCEKKENLQIVDAENLTCRKRGWLYQVLDLATELDAQYRIVYSAGGVALSVILDDVEGAKLLFAKGVVNLPTDWALQYKAAYHALYSEKNKVKAAHLLHQAAQNGAPDWVYVLAGRVSTEAGKREFAERILQEMKALNLDQKLLSRLRQRLDDSADQ